MAKQSWWSCAIRCSSTSAGSTGGLCKGGIVDQGQLRAELKSLLNDTRAACESVPGMGEQFAKVRLPLIYFVDFMVRRDAPPFARSWKHLQEEEAREIVGDEKFFNLLDDAMAEQGDAANQRLAVFYCCLGLGFTGIHLNEPEVLLCRTPGISGRIRSMVDAENSSKITPEAYQSVLGRAAEAGSARDRDVGHLLGGDGGAVRGGELRRLQHAR